MITVLSSFAFNFNLRRFIEGRARKASLGVTVMHPVDFIQAGLAVGTKPRY